MASNQPHQDRRRETGRGRHAAMSLASAAYAERVETKKCT